MKRIAIITCHELPEPDPDESLVIEALQSAGLEVELLAWDRAGHDPSRFDLCILRSCWNYPFDPDGFTKWLHAADSVTTLLNPLPTVTANIHKGYLSELERAGIPIVPTTFFEQNARIDVKSFINARGWDRFVVKPAISASSWKTRLFSRDTLVDAQSFADELISERDIMLQEYMSSVEEGGEKAFIHIDGEFTHAVVKDPRFADADESVSHAHSLSEDEERFAQTVLATSDEVLLYARVDVMLRDDDRILLSELELIEPSLFFLQHPPALERFVAAVCRLAQARGNN